MAIMMTAMQRTSSAAGWREFCADLAELSKLRLNLLVLMSVISGFILANTAVDFPWLKFTQAMLGILAAALAAAIFNQLLEIRQDRQMERTSSRPLAAGRMTPTIAFVIGWVLLSWAVVFLASTTTHLTALLAAATCFIYVFIYTPLKNYSALNTVVGAIAGALPPVCGWLAGGGQWHAPLALALFALLFFWQMPHFIAINWICREEYQRAGFVMWANGDISGEKSARLSWCWSVAFLLTAVLGIWLLREQVQLWARLMLPLAVAPLVFYASKFRQNLGDQAAKKLFFSTLWQLPLCLLILIFGQK